MSPSGSHFVCNITLRITLKHFFRWSLNISVLILASKRCSDLFRISLLISIINAFPHTSDNKTPHWGSGGGGGFIMFLHTCRFVTLSCQNHHHKIRNHTDAINFYQHHTMFFNNNNENVLSITHYRLSTDSLNLADR